MFTTISGKLRRWRTRLLMRSALSGGPLYRVLSRNTGKRFDDRAEGWDAMVAEHQHKWFNPLDAALDQLPADWAPERVLDIGGGTGRGGYHVAERFPDAQIAVVDIAPRMLAFGKGRQQRESLPRVDFVAGDSIMLPVQTESIDLVFILNAPFKPAEMARVLRPGGAAILAFTYSHHTPMYLDEQRGRSSLLRSGFGSIRTGTSGEGSWVSGILGSSEIDQS